MEYTLEDLKRIKAIKYLLEHEHLSSQGVRLRLAKLFPAGASSEVVLQTGSSADLQGLAPP